MVIMIVRMDVEDHVKLVSRLSKSNVVKPAKLSSQLLVVRSRMSSLYGVKEAGNP
jgi:hypothetical protein